MSGACFTSQASILPSKHRRPDERYLYPQFARKHGCLDAPPPIHPYLHTSTRIQGAGVAAWCRALVGRGAWPVMAFASAMSWILAPVGDRRG